MGQKTNPISLRIGINNTWDSKWTCYQDYPSYMKQEIMIRSFIEDTCYYQGISMGKYSMWRGGTLESSKINISVDSHTKQVCLLYFQAYIPQKICGNMDLVEKDKWLSRFEETIQTHLEKVFEYSIGFGILIDPIYEERGISTLRVSKIHGEMETLVDNTLIMWLLNKDCALIAQWIATSFQRRKGLKELYKKLERAFEHIEAESSESRYKIHGFKITCAGRFKLTDNERRRNPMARTKTYKKGQLSLQTLKTHVNYHATTAYTQEGTSGIKVWICYDIV